MQGAPLAQDFGIGPRIDCFIGGNASAFVAGDVADAIATGLDAVQVHAGQKVHHIRTFLNRNPIELDVLSGGEVAVVGGELGGRTVANFVLGGLRVG